LTAIAAATSDLAMDRVTFRVRGIEAVGSEQGAGDPVLLIHGWGGGASNWRRVWPSVASRYRCIAPDLPGWGDSEKPRVPYTFEWYADWLADLLDAKSASPAFVAAHSMGATIALVFALRHPGRVKKLAILNPIVRGSDGVKFETRLLMAPGLRHLAYLFMRRRGFLRFIARNFTESQEGIDDETLMLLSRGTFRSMTRTIKALKAVDLVSSLASIAAPTLIIGSDADREIPPAQSTLASGIPGSRLEMLKGCGHVSPLERPDEVAKLLIDFFGAGMRRGRPPQW
jgi:3-oxoadipate enol-lactonase